MKKLFFILFVLIVASSASAAVYKWVDERGVVNFSDDLSKVPPDYRDKAEEVNVPRMKSPVPSRTPLGKMAAGVQSGETAAQAPPIAQTLIREGDFAIKLAEVLKIGQAMSEAEAESMLATVGIAPKNGWIADYPVTPDIIGELQNAIGETADSSRLAMKKSEAITAFQDLAGQQGLPVRVDTESQYAGVEPPRDYGEYSRPEVINNYYYDQGPPVVTYYPPPPDYSYMYGWVPSPFWCSGFFFPGFFVLRDFNIIVGDHHGHHHHHVISNHFRDHGTGRIFTVDPTRRHAGGFLGGEDTSHRRGFNSTEARKAARSIFERSRERVASANASMPTTDRRANDRNPAYSRSNRGTEKQVDNRESKPPGFNGRNGNYGRPPVIDRKMNRIHGETGFRGMNNRTFSRPDGMNRQNRMNFQRPLAGETRSFSPPSGSNGRSFNLHPQGGGQHSGSSPMGGRGFSGSHGGAGSSSSGFGHGGFHF